ncbi:MAG: S1C family serine protease [Chloroflexota bacterium]
MNSAKTRLIPLLAAGVALFVMACGLTFSSAQPERPSSATRRPADDSSAPATRPALIQATAAPIVLPELTNNEENVLIGLYEQINPAVVNIITYQDQGRFLAPAGQGSGFVYDADGHIVTNSHVVHGADSLDIAFSNGATLFGTVVGEDLHSDLAVVKVDRLPEGVQPLPLAEMGDIHVGQTALAIGNPFGLGGTLTRGIVSALGRTIPALTSFSIPQAIQTDAPINPGNSGGPLLNLKGQVIGVNAQIETGGNSRSNSGVGFAIPVSIVHRVVPSLIENGSYDWGWLGVVGGTVNQALVEAMRLPVDRGAYITQVVPDGPAEKAGLRGARGEQTVNGRVVQVGGDVIVAIDGNPVTSFEDILYYIALNTHPEQTVTVTVVRDGENLDVELVLEPRPAETIDLPQP